MAGFEYWFSKNDLNTRRANMDGLDKLLIISTQIRYFWFRGPIELQIKVVSFFPIQIHWSTLRILVYTHEKKIDSTGNENKS